MFNKNRQGALFLTAVVTLTFAPSLWADDVSNADRLLCASMEATRCSFAGCTTDDPTEFNIPQFVEIDLVNKRLQTTAASGQRRATPFSTLAREDGHIFIQGIEGGRAFSFVIHEESGELNAAVAATMSASAVFAACTPMPTAE